MKAEATNGLMNTKVINIRLRKKLEYFSSNHSSYIKNNKS